MGRTYWGAFYTPDEVAMHAEPGDCWVSYLGDVYDITKVLRDNDGALVQPMLRAAGKDISHWFDEKTGDVKKWRDPVTNLESYYCPMGNFLHINPVDPRSDFATDVAVPWWKDVGNRVGKLTAKIRRVRIKNVLTQQEHVLEVPQEETIKEIQERYMASNWHAASYTWKALVVVEKTGEKEFVTLDMDKNLEENGVPDETPEFFKLDLDEDYYIPVIHVYFNDDLTVA